MPQLIANGLRQCYRLEGRDDRPVLVLSNSLGTDSGMWDRQVASLLHRFRVLRFDTRGHGATEVTAGDYSIDLLGRDLLALADALDIDRFAFCGLSLGGLIGQWLAINAAERLTRAVLCNTAAHLPPAENWSARMATVRRDGMKALVDVVMQRFFSEPYRARDEGFFHTMRWTFLATDPQGYGGCCAAIRDADFRAGTSAIRIPVLVIGGRLDEATPPAMGRSLATSIPQARYIELEAGHLSNIERPEEFTRAVIDFLQ